MMRRQSYIRLLGLAVAALWLIRLPSFAAEDPQNRIEHWQQGYGELRPQDDPLAKRAHTIFERVRHAAGTRPGIVPRLFITKTNPFNVSLPIAIADGWIILSKGAIEICYRDAARGDDRLAFVLGHEIAHQLKDHFWHLRFFQALAASEARAPQDSKVWGEVRRIASGTEEILAKELEADEHGIVYAALAGFDPSAIVADSDGRNFFEEWVQALDPRRIAGVQTAPTHPTSQQRAATIKTRLQQVAEKVELFTWGLRFYEAGDYERAISAFKEFLRFFPSREVYHNLAASHHQLALQYYRLWKPQEAILPFKLSLTVDPVTRAAGTQESFTDGSAQEHFLKHLHEAIEFYKAAVSLDPAYMPSYNNLGCALILEGEAHQAIALLQKALKAMPDSSEVLNNLGVAFVSAEDLAKAEAHLARAHQLAPKYDAPLFNLGKLAYADQNEAEAKKYWRVYLELDPASSWAEAIRQTLADSAPELAAPPGPTAVLLVGEQVMQVAVRESKDEAQARWNKPAETRPLPLPGKSESFTVERYQPGILALWKDKKIQMIVVQAGFDGRSAHGIAIGSAEADVRAHYGMPTRVVTMTQGTSWIYETQGIAFRLRQGQVVSWQVWPVVSVTSSVDESEDEEYIHPRATLVEARGRHSRLDEPLELCTELAALFAVRGTKCNMAPRSLRTPGLWTLQSRSTSASLRSAA